MANLDFRTATQTQATGYAGDGTGTDVIFFSTGSATGTVVTVNPALGADPETITITHPTNPVAGSQSLNFAPPSMTGTNRPQSAQ